MELMLQKRKNGLDPPVKRSIFDRKGKNACSFNAVLRAFRNGCLAKKMNARALMGNDLEHGKI